MATLPLDTWIRLVVWMAIGLVIYFVYGRHHSVLGTQVSSGENGWSRPGGRFVGCVKAATTHRRAVSFSHFDRIWESEAPAEPIHFPQITDWLGRSLGPGTESR